MISSGGSTASLGEPAIFGILTISDRASSGEYVDEGGPAICGFFEEAIRSPWKVVYHCVPDEQEVIEAALVELVDEQGCNVVVTTGGTGPTPRDITPEATAAVCDKLLPGFGEQMRAISLKFVPTAILSRQIGGIRGSSLLFNLPGRPKAIRETIDEIWRAVPYCIDLLNGPYIECDRQVCDDFRPKTARR
ncbi:MAG: molybdopterin adenylyltransferase [Euryarchaeota archaeon]|jgi:molybdopterin adenylyltransferase|nr:molybdopterin adenylyltransferase [Euryarchaeota archaeon]MBT7937667.1 molybdopterin adenylyltransferase [Euryarchaeota archaeon]